MSKFEINRINIEEIRAILRFHFSFPHPTMYENNFQILFLYIVGGGKEKRNLKIALVYLILLRFISNFDNFFPLLRTTEIQKKSTLAAKLTD